MYIKSLNIPDKTRDMLCQYLRRLSSKGIAWKEMLLRYTIKNRTNLQNDSINAEYVNIFIEFAGNTT